MSFDIDKEPIVWLDLETGGTDAAAHQVTQVACAATIGKDFKLCNDDPTFERKVELVPERYTPAALDLQNYDEAVWAAEAMPVYEVLGQLERWLRGFVHMTTSKAGKPYPVCHMAGYNLGFDCDFLDATCKRNGPGPRGYWLPLSKWRGGYLDVLDLVLWGRAFYNWTPKDVQLATVCGYFDIPIDAHDAMGDVLATIKLAQHVAAETGLRLVT